MSWKERYYLIYDWVHRLSSTGQYTGKTPNYGLFQNKVSRLSANVESGREVLRCFWHPIFFVGNLLFQLVAGKDQISYQIDNVKATPDKGTNDIGENSFLQ